MKGPALSQQTRDPMLLIRVWFDVGPPSTTVAQYQTNIGPCSRASWDLTIRVCTLTGHLQRVSVAGVAGVWGALPGGGHCVLRAVLHGAAGRGRADREPHA